MSSSSIPEYVDRVQLGYMNLSADPCSDFYEFACGGFVEKATIPQDRGSIDLSWDQTQQDVDLSLRSLSRGPYPFGSPFHAVEDWYASCRNTSNIATAELRPLLRNLRHIQTRSELDDAVAFFHTWGLPTFLQFKVASSVQDRTAHALFVRDGTLLLPSIAAYLSVGGEGEQRGEGGEEGGEGGEGGSQLRRLQEYATDVFRLAGYGEEEAEAGARAAVATEVSIARWKAGEAASLHPKAPPAPLNASALHAKYPGVCWACIFSSLSSACEASGFLCLQQLSGDSPQVIVESPLFLSSLSHALLKDEPSSWTWYLQLRLIASMEPALPYGFQEARLRRDASLLQATAPPPRWRVCVAEVSSALRGLTDLLFLASSFPVRHRKTAAMVLSRVKASFLRTVDETAWLDDKTRRHAQAKASAMLLNLGGPETFSLVRYPVTADSFFNNSMFAHRANTILSFLELDRPVDRTKWEYAASTVNAWFDQGLNAVFVPAGILLPPFFSPAARPEQNFGGIGTVVGHEITHGFDTRGALFDEGGRREDWWDPETKKEFQSRAACVASQYDGVTVAGTPVDGRRVVAESIADAGGVKVAFEALLEWGREATLREPSSAERRGFFLAYAQLWCEKDTPQHRRFMAGADKHAPKALRVNTVLAAFPPFAAAFSCPPAAPLNPPHRCHLW